MDISEEMIVEMGQIARLTMAPPCDDLSLQRGFDRDGRFSKEEAAKRPGLDGPSDKVFRKCLKSAGG